MEISPVIAAMAQTVAQTDAAVVSGKLGPRDIIANPRFGRRTGF
jgi:hypothetical protein